MPLILVVEQEQRYVERIEEALGPQGWEVVGVDDREGAMRFVADREADLVVVNAAVGDAPALVETFSRANGGPGAVVLLPESGDNGVAREQADEILRKPFTDQEIRLAVRRCVSAPREDARAEEAAPDSGEPSLAEGERLSSADLFGDVMQELEDAFTAGARGDDEVPQGVSAEEAGAEAEMVIAEEAAVEAEAQAETEEESDTEEEPGAEEEPEAEVDAAAEAEEDAAEEAAKPEAAADATPEKEVDGEAAVEEEVSADVDLDEPGAEEAAEAEPVDEEHAEEELAAAAPDEGAPGEPEEEAAPRPRKLLEERLAEAVVAGKDAAARQSAPVGSPSDAGQEADLLLRKALETLGVDMTSTAKIDPQFSKPARATREEVDDLLSTVVGKPKRAQPSGAPVGGDEPGDTPAGSEPPAQEPALEAADLDAAEGDESEYRSRMKLLWTVVLVAAVIVFLFLLLGSRGGGDDAPDVAPTSSQAPERAPLQTSPAQEDLAEEVEEPGAGAESSEEEGDGA